MHLLTLKGEACPPIHNTTSLILGSFITVGLFISYLPQFQKIVKEKSSQGLSVWFLLLGFMGCVSTLANVALLQAGNVACCFADWSAFTCFENTLGLTQVTVQFFCFSFIVLFFYKYYPANLKETSLHKRDIRVSYVFISYVTLATLLVSFLVFLPYHSKKSIKAVAGVFGAIAMTTAVCQFFPQILHTWNAKKVGALSIPMMMMQVPGAFIFVYSLASQPGTNPSTWLSFLLTGILQSVLLALCLYYSRKGNKEEEEEETDPLIAESGRRDGAEAERGYGTGGDEEPPSYDRSQRGSN